MALKLEAIDLILQVGIFLKNSWKCPLSETPTRYESLPETARACALPARICRSSSSTGADDMAVLSLSLSLPLQGVRKQQRLSLSLSLSFLRQGLKGLVRPPGLCYGASSLSRSLALSLSLSLSLPPLLLRNIYPILTDLPASSASYLACRTTAARKTSGNMRSCVAVFVIHSPEQPDWDLNPDWPRDAKSFNSAEVHKDPLAVLVREDWPWL